MQRYCLVITCVLLKLCLAQSPKWIPVEPMSHPRESHQQTLLVDGRVLVTGILNCPRVCPASNSAELYDSRTGAWSPAAEMRRPRRRHTAVRLQNGSVLVAGGRDASGVAAEAELYDAVSNTWRPTGNLNSARSQMGAVLLDDGRVLVTGGTGSDPRVILSSTEIYDPATDSWTMVAPMNSPRLWHTVTRLADGKVLVAGGISAFNSTPLKTAELFDPATETWVPAGEMRIARAGHTATLLPNGSVLIAGGPEEATGTELFDPATQVWIPTGGMRVGHGAASATLLPNGRVLVVGGYNLAVTFFDENLSSSEIYDPDKNRWDPGPALVHGRAEQQATLLKNGTVLVTGGMANWDADVVIGDAEIFGSGGIDAGSIATVSAASFMDNASLAPDSIAAAFGRNLAELNSAAEPVPLPMAATNLHVLDAAGTDRDALLMAVSPEQINFLIPSDVSPGQATVTVFRGRNKVASGTVEIRNAAPALFTMESTGGGLPVAEIERIGPDGTRATESIGRFDPELNQFVPIPVNLGSPDVQVLLLLYATGVRGYATGSRLEATIGGVRTQVISVEALSELPGIDRLAVSLPHRLARRGEVEVAITVDGFESNRTLLAVQ